MSEVKTDEQLAAEKVAAAVATIEGAKQIEHKLDDGTIIKGKDWEDVAKQAVKMKTDTATALRDREEQIRRLKEMPPETREAITDKTKPAFDNKKYQELWLTDPVAAQDYVDSHRFGVENPRQMFIDTITETSINRQMREIANFHQRNQDFPGGDEAAAKIMERLQAEGRAITADNLEIAYLAAIRSGELKPVKKEEGSGGEDTARRGAPNLGNSNSSTEVLDQDAIGRAENMSLDDLRKVLNAAGKS